MRLAEDVARRLVRDARVARLATIDPDGSPNLVPFCFALVGDTLYSAVDAKPKERPNLQRLANIDRDPRVAVLVDRYDEDWTAVWWVRVRGQARVLDDDGERERGLSALTQKYPQYVDEPPSGPVIAIAARSWRGWSASPVE